MKRSHKETGNIYLVSILETDETDEINVIKVGYLSI